MDKQKIYFPNLNGLRFIAAFLVIVHHIEQFKSMFNIHLWELPSFIVMAGKLGVILFFVLSGFLITYLLLAEEQSFKKISIRKFYIRRILRIWPLYFLIMMLAFFVLPNIDLFVFPDYSKAVIYDNLGLKLFFYAIFLPNMALYIGLVPYASHAWSIGTEEQFYLIWPVLIGFFKKYRIALMVFIVLFYLFFSCLLNTTLAIQMLPGRNALRAFWSTFNIDCMAIGGIYAVLLFNKSKLLKLLMHVYVFYLTIVVTMLLMLFTVKIPFIHYAFYSVLFGIIILNFASNKAIKISLENKVFNYLGNISYGLYMYHPIGIVLAIGISQQLDLVSYWLVYPLSFFFTIVLAGISYRYFESYFLKFKTKFTNIVSGSKPAIG